MRPIQLGDFSRSVARHGRLAFWVATTTTILWIAALRNFALDPPALWGDDVAVACLTRLDSFWGAITVASPMAPGFVGLLWIARRVLDDPEVSLQILPLAFSLIGPMLIGLAVCRLAASRALGFIAIVMGLGNGFLAQYSVNVKPYSLDYALSSLLLLLAVYLLVDQRNLHGAATATGLAAVLFSAPTVFLSLALVHLGALGSKPKAGGGPSSKWFRWGTVAGFDLMLVTLYFLVYSNRSSRALKVLWGHGFAPSGSLADFAGFLRTNGWPTIQYALPEPFVWLAPLAVLGLVALVLDARRRWFGLFVALVYAGAVGASMLRVYPIGLDERSRASIYLHGMTLLLVVLGLDILTRRLPIRTLTHAAVALLAVFSLTRQKPPVYPALDPGLDHAHMARTLELRAAPADAIVLNYHGARVAGYYTSWPVSIHPDNSPFGYQVWIERPRTLMLPLTADRGGRSLSGLDEFLARVRPPRVFLFSARRPTGALDEVIRAHGFVEARHDSGGADLIEYHHPGP